MKNIYKKIIRKIRINIDDYNGKKLEHMRKVLAFCIYKLSDNKKIEKYGYKEIWRNGKFIKYTKTKVIEVIQPKNFSEYYALKQKNETKCERVFY